MSNDRDTITNIQILQQVKAFARQDGALLSLLWIGSFALLILAPSDIWSNLIGISTPFFVGWRLCKFRNYALDGVISFRRGLAYSLYTFFYASLIFAIAQYAYFRFMDHGTFLAMLSVAMQQIIAVYTKAGIDTRMFSETLSSMATLKPIHWSFVFMMQNIMIGFIISFPIAAVCARRVKRENKNQTTI